MKIILITKKDKKVTAGLVRTIAMLNIWPMYSMEWERFTTTLCKHRVGIKSDENVTIIYSDN